MATSLETTLAGERVHLMADRALFWPARNRLLVADLHLGKADIFRRAGIGLPAGGTQLDLDRVTMLLSLSGARELWVLGDMLHGAALDTHWRAQWTTWRARHPDLRIGVLTGNHDRALAGAGLELELLGPAEDDGPFAMRHMPETHASLHVLCGHVHPRLLLPGIARPCAGFWLRDNMTVLPAFSRFTGGYEPRLQERERFAVCVEGDVVLIEPASSTRRPKRLAQDTALIEISHSADQGSRLQCLNGTAAGGSLPTVGNGRPPRRRKGA